MCRYDRNVDNLVTDVALQISVGLFLLVHELGLPDKRGTQQFRSRFRTSSLCLSHMLPRV